MCSISQKQVGYIFLKWNSWVFEDDCLFASTVRPTAWGAALPALQHHVIGSNKTDGPRWLLNVPFALSSYAQKPVAQSSTELPRASETSSLKWG